MCVSKPRPKDLLAAIGAFLCLSKGDRNICLESLGAYVDAEGAVRVKSLLHFIRSLHHPKVAGSFGYVAYGNCVDFPAGTVPFGAELGVGGWYDA